uniref:Holocarboxylase synthetase n=1 Tax=Lepisosteus oculatus TaxID=7918 RepID=W5MCE9_LEPOC|nr:PREDICTED: biotin--protein ligase isoform X1 [Lepisosteus oculatus]
MLITLCYVYLWVRFQRCYTVVIRSTVRRLCGGSRGFAFRTLEPGQWQKSQPAAEKSFQAHSPSLREDKVFLRLGDKVFCITEPQPCDDLSKWTVLLGSPLVYLDSVSRAKNIAFVIEASSDQELALKSLPTSRRKILKWSDHCLPLARSPGQPFKAIAEASVEDFSQIGVAFMEDRLQMDNGLVPDNIVSVLLQESALRELVEKRQMATDKQSQPSRPQESPGMGPVAEAASGHGGDRGGAVQQRSQPDGDGQQSSETVQGEKGETGGREQEEEEAEMDKEEANGVKDHHKEGHHLHLSSCHECLELENCTIESVKFASAENIPDLPDDYMGSASREEEEEDERSCGQSRRASVTGKPPNVLVYAGQEPAESEARYRRVRGLLAECLDADSYVVYQLRHEQVLRQPWLESARLVVLASDEPLAPALRQRFLSYVSLGGRLLGLSSPFCFGGLAVVPKAALRNRVHRLRFGRAGEPGPEPELELSVMASGGMFVREGDAEMDGQVELWGQLSGQDKDVVVVRLARGDRGGRAVLCQVRLETSPDSGDVQNPEDFDELKVSNARRYEAMSKILSSLGLSCEPSQVPPPSPIHLLSSSQDSRDRFLKWLWTKVDREGVLKSPKVSLKVASTAAPQTEQTEGLITLVTEPSEPEPSEQFCFHTYARNLQTGMLGHLVLYAEVTPTTMDLLEGLMLQLPQEMGLIAIAARQTQGKGRGGNAWLSPVGCAMFTLHVRVPVSSALGQRIPFLQHLAALAVVEAVRTLPGYEDIDLRVKWPNDIYYSDLMKLGGVLVTSTLMGSTFHALVGCGFNVRNSNPTICVNDLVVQHNKERGTALALLDTAQLIGRSVTLLEQLIQTFQDQGPQGVLPLYYRRWVHSGTQVRLWREDGPQVAVVGLDDNGFLQVASPDRRVVSVQPDGNSFDMLRNLVVAKQH